MEGDKYKPRPAILMMVQKLLGMVLVIFGITAILVDASFTTEFMARGEELHKTCPLPPAICPFIGPPWQGVFIGVIGFALAVIGIYLYRKTVPVEPPKPALDAKKIEETLNKLDGDEKNIYQIIADEKGMMFQSKLIERTGFTKVKVSRVLDSLEMKGLIERKRRGMTNVVVLK